MTGDFSSEEARRLWLALPTADVEAVLSRALAEDTGWGDITTATTVEPDWPGQARIVARQEGVLAGAWVAEAVFDLVDADLTVALLAADGEPVRPGQTVLEARGSAASILTGERVALNFVQRLSGVASLARRYAEAVAGLPVRIVDTRKTTPGLRLLEKYAVRAGGAHNHRFNLADAILIKDNHLQAAANAGRGLAEVVALARARAPHTLKIQVEVETLDQAREALAAGADALLLDNMSLADLRAAVELAAGRVQLEASGGITLDRVRAVAQTGVDLISVGALTHSAPALDFSLDFEPG